MNDYLTALDAMLTRIYGYSWAQFSGIDALGCDYVEVDTLDGRFIRSDYCAALTAALSFASYRHPHLYDEVDALLEGDPSYV